MTYRVKSNEGVPQLTPSEKLEQIRSGKKLERRRSGIDVNQIILATKDGSKITKKETAEKYEETTVKRKKRNYIMYESKLGTEKNTQIIGIEKPIKKPPPRPARTPAPRVEERIIQKRKKKEYLDNYQYLEVKVIRKKNPRTSSVVIHKRLGDIWGGTYEETTSQKQIFVDGRNRPQLQQQKTTISTTGTVNNPRLRGNRSEVTNTKQPSATATNFHVRTNSTIINERTQRKDSTQKSGVVTNQIMSRRGGPNQTKTEVKKTINITRVRNQPDNQEGKKSSRRMPQSESAKVISITKTETKLERKQSNPELTPEVTPEVNPEVTPDNDKSSVRKRYQKK
jgi:hypothetical protein